MIKQLRRKFITISVLSVFAALFLIIASINILSYRDITRSLDTVIGILEDNDDRFPGRRGEINGMAPPDMGFDPRRPEMEYDSRYFVVYLTGDHQVKSIYLDFIASVDTDKAVLMAEDVVADGKAKGFTGNYRYSYRNGKIVFLEASRELEQFRTFLVTSIIISGIAFVVAFAMIFILSGKILAPVAESYEKQKRFITDAGHELKTPLAVIKADLDVLETDGITNEWTEDIVKQADRLSSLTNDLIHLSRMEEIGKVTRIEFPISDVAEQTAGSFAAAAVSSNKELVTEISPNISYEGDEKAIRELFNILLDNAVKYSPENERIIFSLDRDGRDIVIKTRNKAGGLTEDQVSHLFDRFYRADGSRDSSGGFGIGLSVAKAITDNHGGKICAELVDDEIEFRVVL